MPQSKSHGWVIRVSPGLYWGQTGRVYSASRAKEYGDKEEADRVAVELTMRGYVVEEVCPVKVRGGEWATL